MSPIWIALLGFLGILVTGGSGYLIARRNTSGSVATTDAATLWNQSNEMRQELRNEVVELRSKVDNFDGQVTVLKEQNAELRGKHDECQRNEAMLREQLVAQRVRLERLEGAIERRGTKRTTPRKPS